MRGFARAARLATALRTYATRTPDGCEKATISLCARVVITLVSSTLRDTSFYIIYLEVPLTDYFRSRRDLSKVGNESLTRRVDFRVYPSEG